MLLPVFSQTIIFKKQVTETKVICQKSYLSVTNKIIAQLGLYWDSDCVKEMHIVDYNAAVINRDLVSPNRRT